MIVRVLSLSQIDRAPCVQVTQRRSSNFTIFRKESRIGIGIDHALASVKITTVTQVPMNRRSGFYFSFIL